MGPKLLQPEEIVPLFWVFFQFTMLDECEGSAAAQEWFLGVKQENVRPPLKEVAWRCTAVTEWWAKAEGQCQGVKEPKVGRSHPYHFL